MANMAMVKDKRQMASYKLREVDVNSEIDGRRKSYILSELETKGIVSYKGKGNSMVPKIKSGDRVTVKRVSPEIYRKGDMVYCKVKGSYFLHLLTAIKGNRYQISNNSGHVNGSFYEVVK